MPDNIVIEQDDIAIQFLITIVDNNDESGGPMDLTAFSNFIIYFKRPDKTVLQVPGLFFEDGTDGQIYCITRAGDLSISGRYTIQVSYRIGNSLVYTSKDTFMVEEDISAG